MPGNHAGEPPAVLHTERLILRPARLDDAEAIFRGYAQDPEVTRFLIWVPHASVADTKQFLLECVEAWRGGRRFPWAITTAVDRAVIGMIELRLHDHMAQVGYALARAEWGKGYATEALRAVIDHALALPMIWRVSAVCDVENIASARVMEKSGMLKEGTLRRFVVHPNISDEPRDVHCYAKTR